MSSGVRTGEAARPYLEKGFLGLKEGGIEDERKESVDVDGLVPGG
jgi:hypothetical protein